MSNIALFRPNQPAQYLISVNTPDYSSDPDALINPDISALSGVPLKHWKRVGNAIEEMTLAEKQAIADAELTQRKNAADLFQADPVAIFTALVKVINARLNQSQKITKQELIDAIKLEIT